MLHRLRSADYVDPAKSARQFLPSFVALCIVAVLFCVPAVSALAQALAPHNALYSLKLLSARGGSSIERVGGEMAVRWERDCNGWTMNHRTVFDIGYATGEQVRVTIDASSWEAADGRSYNFYLRTLYGDREGGRTEGHAELRSGGNRAVYSAPEVKTMKLPADVMFPTRHTQQVLAKAAEAPTIFAAEMFDGFGDDGAQLVNAVIGRPLNPGPPERAKFDALAGLKSWPIQLAFFSPADQAVPESEIGMRLYENGVAEGLDMDFGDFRVKADLARLEMIEAPVCSN